jgi:hypothetical protein
MPRVYHRTTLNAQARGLELFQELLMKQAAEMSVSAISDLAWCQVKFGLEHFMPLRLEIVSPRTWAASVCSLRLRAVLRALPGFHGILVPQLAR